MEDDIVRTERGEGWLEIVINRPDRRNSIIAPVSEAMREALAAAAQDDGVSSVIIRGEGGYFCSGVDLKALQADPPPPWRDRQGSSWRALHLALYDFPKPVIGAFEKFGINAGSALALACDILVAGETAFLQVGEIQQGVAAPMNFAWLRIKTNEQVMSRLCFYGDRVTGPELVRLGLAAECVADESVVSRCREISARLAGFPPGASANIKRGIIRQRGIDDPEAWFPKQAGSGPGLLGANMVKG
ncbi:MAG: enoyl-CoA hydratase/isomerase family protein [Pseudomonadales bacterium]|nr:enoyl-CoA hydratase/isomerase family protein [Pseudomonadales bacterium]